VPAGAAMRSLLALKLFGAARTSHGMAAVFDEGLALFAGLNVTPKRSFLTEYSCRIPPSCYPELMSAWFEAMTALGLQRGVSFHLDFHTIPFHGEDALIEKHYERAPIGAAWRFIVGSGRGRSAPAGRRGV
jgi:hypothetical protein